MDDYLNFAEAARLLDMSRQAVRQKVVNGNIEYVPGKGIPAMVVFDERNKIIGETRRKLARMTGV